MSVAVLRSLARAQGAAAATRGVASQATFETKLSRGHRLDGVPETQQSMTRDDALAFFRQMHVIRRLETSAGNLYKEKAVRGFCHLYSGQEAVAVGLKAALRPQDGVISAYRVHGWTHLMGVTPEAVLCELTGRKSGCARGKGGSMHMYCENFYGGNGIVGAQVPLGAGVALAAKYLGTGGVCVALYGDGAANQGQIFETYNMAKLWALPVIFVCENNGYGMGTSAERGSANTAYYTRGDAVPGLLVDGMDVLATRAAGRLAVEHCVSGKGPLLLEAVTYRYSGHSMSDPGTSYRTRDEVAEVRSTRDPIASLRERILSADLATPEELKAIEAAVRVEIDNATKKARTDTEIPLPELTADVYSAPLEDSVRGITPWAPWAHQRIGEAVNLK